MEKDREIKVANISMTYTQNSDGKTFRVDIIQTLVDDHGVVIPAKSTIYKARVEFERFEGYLGNVPVIKEIYSSDLNPGSKLWDIILNSEE